ncbi:DMT family transporter [Vibrio sagamiensis]|uniref:Multidrug transporter n=1 Tax=Vibrio sagamiensis NBRC 104589 TaxID=1219064 RepID=A0A511QI92_9VIBR|nr:DMT family transporter [Vibrio sagamiensis]PNQ70782.1 EamA/RhaT family transporter [Vibrio agarivorans]GEM77023.1 multidrug transporter [Vibrio sagamiensis NBRC 104589]
MSSNHLALLLLVIGNLAASLSDVAVKLIEGGISPFQYMFLRQCFTLLLILPFYLKQKQGKKDLKQAPITLIRAHLILLGSGCMMVAITYLPLTTANAVFYAAPLLMLPLSVCLLKEHPSLSKILMTCFGFIGVLVVLRPTQFHWAAFFALGTAITLALFNILVRRLPSEQTVVTTLWWTTLFSLPLSALLATFYWHSITARELALVLISAACILSYNGLAVWAYKNAPAGDIAFAEYSGLVFVTIFGIYWFNEIPDLLNIIGMVMIIMPIILKNTISSHNRLAKKRYDRA